ncbi:MAG: hypothetical protein SOU51_00115, partial [Collinsella sp.]|nr:hypothetical protein [Collinsella sp.]
MAHGHQSPMPLYYAIIMHFMDGGAHDAAKVVRALEPVYGSYKLLTVRDVAEALATAKENGLLDEAGYGVDANGELRIDYRINDFGRDMVERYLIR